MRNESQNDTLTAKPGLHGSPYVMALGDAAAVLRHGASSMRDQPSDAARLERVASFLDALAENRNDKRRNQTRTA